MVPPTHTTCVPLPPGQYAAHVYSPVASSQAVPDPSHATKPMTPSGAAATARAITLVPTMALAVSPGMHASADRGPAAPVGSAYDQEILSLRVWPASTKNTASASASSGQASGQTSGPAQMHNRPAQINAVPAHVPAVANPSMHNIQ